MSSFAHMQRHNILSNLSYTDGKKNPRILQTWMLIAANFRSKLEVLIADEDNPGAQHFLTFSWQ